MTLIYLLLGIIIVLLLVIIYSKRDKSADYFNKSLGSIKGIKDFERNDSRNETHPDEIVRYMGFRYVTRREAETLDKPWADAERNLRKKDSK